MVMSVLTDEYSFALALFIDFFFFLRISLLQETFSSRRCLMLANKITVISSYRNLMVTKYSGHV